MGIFSKERSVPGVVEKAETPELTDEVKELGVEAKTDTFTAQVKKKWPGINQNTTKHGG